MKDALTGITFGVLVVAGVLGLMWLASVIPDPAPTTTDGVVIRTASGWIGFWIFLGLVIAGHDVYIAGNKIADAIRDRRRAPDE